MAATPHWASRGSTSPHRILDLLLVPDGVPPWGGIWGAHPAGGARMLSVLSLNFIRIFLLPSGCCRCQPGEEEFCDSTARLVSGRCPRAAEPMGQEVTVPGLALLPLRVPGMGTDSNPTGELFVPLISLIRSWGS